MAEGKLLPDILFYSIEEAVARLKQEGFVVEVMSTETPRQKETVRDGETRVVRVSQKDKDTVALVTVKWGKGAI